MARFYMSLKKATKQVEDEDGVLTSYGMDVAHDYAVRWQDNEQRDLALEQQYPELSGLFYDIRNDTELASEHALPMEKSAMGKKFYMPLSKAQPIFYGPRGGKYLDAQHKIPYTEENKKKMGKKQEDAGKKKRGSETKTEGRNWVDHHPDLPEFTDQHYKNPDGSYKKERQPVHAEIVKSFFVSEETGRRVTPVPPGTKKQAIVLMGGPASGKTSTVKHLLGTDDFADANFVNVNPDDCKEKMPEYNQALNFEKDGVRMSAKDAAWMAHEESSDIAGQVHELAIAQGMNIVLDGTGKTADKHIERVRKLQEAGYHVQLVMPDVDVDDAWERSSGRAERTGRWVPEDILRDAHAVIPANFETIARQSDEFYLFDTRNSKPGQPPDLKWSGAKGKDDVVHDERFVGEFKERGQRLLAEHKEKKARKKAMKKSYSEDTLTKADDNQDVKLTVSFADMLANMEKTKGTTWESDEIKFPGAGKNGNGVLAVVEDVDYDKRKGIEYK
jgi:predicted ABC-type ATPase